MNICKPVICALLLFPLASCIKSEAPSPEADIITCELPADIVKTDPKITNDAVMILVNKGLAEVESLAPEFTLSPGATISPASGTARNFETPQYYTVTSEDGKWSKTYTVTVIDAEVPTSYSFEYWNGSGKYENPYEPITPPGGGEILKMLVWSSGNAGYAIINGKVPSDFPTSKSTDSDEGIYAAKLETKKTGFAPLPMAAGNLFLGTFDASQAMQSPLKATRFGVPFGKKPLRLSGSYKYTPGPVYTDREGNVLADKTDRCQIYAVLYEKGEGELLDGTNVLGDYDRLIASAVVETSASQSYVDFDIPFDYDVPKYVTEFDPAKMAGYKYYLAVVFAASAEGARFEGAEGSVLYVDNVNVICEE